MSKIISTGGASPHIYSKRYDKFSGVDFLTDLTQIDDNRSPFAVNIVSDAGGFPEKRVGWRTLKQFDDAINGIYDFMGKMVVHSGNKMYYSTNLDFTEFETFKKDGTEDPVEINDDKSFGIVFGEKLWILTGREFLVFDGNELKRVKDIATIPQVLSQANDSLRNGISYQPFNLLTPKRKVGVKADGSSLAQIMLRQQINISSLKVYNAITGEEITGNPNASQKYDLDRYVEDGKFYYKIIFTPAIQASGTGEDIILEFEPLETPNAEKNANIIEKCRFMAIYENRLFVGGNPDYPNTDFYCELNDPTYFADVNYTAIGTDNESPSETEEKEREENFIGTGGTKVLGYSYVGNYLAIHKDGAENGASLYLRSSQMTDDGMIFPVKEGIVGESIVSHFSTCSFIDDPLFLTKSGVYAIASADVTGERCLQSRSTRINVKLSLEKDLENAVCCTWNGYYMLFINGNVYVADSRQKTYPRNTSNAYEYEWYFWDSIPARVVLSHNDTVYFGTEDGKVCRLNNDMLDGRGGYSMLAYNDDGAPIVATWSAKMDDFDDFGTFKTLKRRGCSIHVKSFGATNIKLLVRTEKEFEKQIGYARRGLFNFQSMDFNNFTFNTQPFSFIPFTQKVKDFRMLQVICRNDEVNQALGVYAIELKYIKGYFAK